MMRTVMRVAATTLVVSTALAAVQGRTHVSPGKTVVTFPVELQGTWNPVPYDCESTAEKEAENDMRFELAGSLRNNYEDIEQIRTIERVVVSPATWHVVAVSNVLGDDEGHSTVYVFGGGRLFVTDGSRMDAYVRCE